MITSKVVNSKTVSKAVNEVVSETVTPAVTPVITTLEDVSRYAERAPGAILRIEDISYTMAYIKDFPTYLRLRMTVDIQSAQRRLWDETTPDTATYLKKQIVKSTVLLQQFDLPKNKRDPFAQIEIDGHETYFKRTRNW